VAVVCGKGENIKKGEKEGEKENGVVVVLTGATRSSVHIAL
jgi:hypothetical protein